jgi:large subunit ribosomal protein L17
MRHRKSKVTLDRKAGPRRALLRSLAISLIEHGRIRTTPAKARAVRPLVERAVTVGKRNTLAARRQLIKTLGSLTATERILTTFSPRFAKRPGGYTRQVKLSPRAGDGAQQVLLEFLHD